jgi:hypothetical protein
MNIHAKRLPHGASTTAMRDSPGAAVPTGGQAPASVATAVLNLADSSDETPGSSPK